MQPFIPIPATLFGLGTGELVVIFLIVLLLFGGAKLPQLTRSLGKSIKEFKRAINDEDKTEETAGKTEDKAPDKTQQT